MMRQCRNCKAALPTVDNDNWLWVDGELCSFCGKSCLRAFALWARREFATIHDVTIDDLKRNHKLRVGRPPK